MIDEAELKDAIVLGDFVYDPREKRLTDGCGEEVFLRPQSALVFDVLASRLGAIVPKDDLVREVWPDLNVTDDSLTQCIADIRRAIGDKARRIVQTLPKRGYRLVATERSDRQVDGGASSADLEDVLASPQTKALVFVDVVDSVRLLEQAEKQNISRWLDFVASVENSLVTGSNGRVVKNLGDGLFLEFDQAASAMKCAFALNDLAGKLNRDVEPEDMMLLRTSVDIGEVHTPDGMDYYGRRVSRAARLMRFARPGEIVVSTDVRDALPGELECAFEDLGDLRIRGSNETVRAFRALAAGSTPLIRPVVNAQDLLPTIAVVPFATRRWGQDTNTVGEIVAEDIISRLARSNEVNVISRLSSTNFRNRNASLAEIGEILKADFVVTGTVGGSGADVVLDVELADVETQRVLWAERLETKVASLLADSETIEWIASRVRRTIVIREAARAKGSAFPSLKSHTMMIGAVALMHRLSPRDFQTARSLLEELIERAPHEAAPLAWLARWHVLKVQQGWSDDPAGEAAVALQCTRRALDMDPENVLALVNEGLVLTNLSRRLDEAQFRYDTAIDVSPNDAVGRLLRGTLHAFRGEGMRAVRDTERALHLSPLDPHRFFFLSLAASACVAAEDYERADLLASQSLRMNRSHTSTLRVKAVAQMRLGRADEARRTAGELMRLQPNLRVGAWLKTTPSADFEVGRRFAETLRETGIPD